MKVEFEIARADSTGFYTETDLSHDVNLRRLYEQSLDPAAEFNGRIRIGFEAGPDVYFTDALPFLIRTVCSEAVNRLSSGREAIVNYCSHYGSICMQPLNNYIFISGDVSTNERDIRKEKAYVCPKQKLLDSFSTCYHRYQAFVAKWRDLRNPPRLA